MGPRCKGSLPSSTKNEVRLHRIREDQTFHQFQRLGMPFLDLTVSI